MYSESRLNFIYLFIYLNKHKLINKISQKFINNKHNNSNSLLIYHKKGIFKINIK